MAGQHERRSPVTISDAQEEREHARVVSGRLWVDVISGGTAGVQYTEGDIDASITGVAVMWEDTSDTLRSVSAAKPLPVNVVAGAAGGVSHIDDAAFTPGTDDVVPAAGTFRSVRDLVDDNDAGALAMTQRRALLVSIEDSVGDSAMDDANNALRVNVVAGAAGGTQYTEGDIDATVTGTAVMWEDAADTLRVVSVVKPLPVIPGFQFTDNTTFGASVDGIALTGAVVNPTSGTLASNKRGALAMDGNRNLKTVVELALPPGGNNIGDVDVLSVVPGTGATNLGKAEDDVHVSGDVGIMALAVRRDTPTGLAAALDYHPLEVDPVGRLWVNGALYTEGDIDATISGTAVMWEDAADTLRAVSAAKPLPVNVVSGAAGGVSHVDDAAFTTAVDDVVPAAGIYRSVRDLVDDNDAGAFAMTQRRAILASLEDSTGDSAMDDANNAVRVNVVAGSAAGVSHVDDAAFTPAVDDIVPVAGFFNDATPDSVNEGDAGVLRMSANRNLYVRVRDNAGNERGLNIDASGNANAVVNNGAGASAVNVQDGGNSLTVDGTVSVSGTVTVDTELPAAGALADNDANPTTSRIGANLLLWDGATWDRGPGNSADGALVNLGANNDVTVAGTVTVDSELPPAAALADTTANPTTPSVGTLPHVFNGTTWDRARGDITNGLDVDVTRVTGTVTVDSELPVAAALSADNVANPTAPAVGSFGHYFDGTNWDRTRGDSTDGLLVNLGVNNDVIQATASNLNAQVVGGVAHDGADAGNPVKIGGKAVNAAPSVVSANLDRTDAIFDFYGQQYVRPDHVNSWFYHHNNSSALTDLTVKAAPGANLSIYITDVVVSTGAATAFNVFFEEGTSTVVLGPYYLEAVAGRGVAVSFNTPRKITADKALTITTSAAIAHGIDVTGFVAP